MRTLDTLDHFPAKVALRFLTARTNERVRKVAGALRDFQKEHSNAEFRVTANPSELHDRYILSDESLLVLGHGLKDIGGKESFMIQVNKDLVPDLLSEVRGRFDARWKSARPL